MIPLWDDVILEQHLLHARQRNDEELKKREKRVRKLQLTNKISHHVILF